MSDNLASNSLTSITASYWLNMLLTMLAPVFWGTTYIVTTQLLPPDLPLFASVMRVLPAGMILVLFARQLPQSGQWRRMIILSFLNISSFQALLFVAAYRLPGGIAAVVGAIQPLVILLLIWRIDHLSPKPITMLATCSAIIGMAMLLVTEGVSWDKIGLLAALLGAVSMALGVYLTKRWKPEVSNLTFTGWQLLFGGIMLLPLSMMLETLPNTFTYTNILGYAYLAIFGSLIAYSLWFRGIEKLPSVAVSILGSLSPITATIIGWYWLNQQLSVFQFCGFVLVLVSIFVVQRNNKAVKS